MMSEKTNVVLFTPHDTGRMVSPYGCTTVHTPNCERMAAEGVRFENSFCVSPLCAPSRAACVTGRYPHQNGVMGLTGTATGAFDLYQGERHAASIFQGAGYNTALCGFEHETPHWQNHGFQKAMSGRGGWFNGGGDLREHAGAIDGWLGEIGKEKPFYLQIGCHETHHSWTDYDTPPDDSLGVSIPPYLRDIPEVRREMAEMQGAVRRLDFCLGEILNALEKRGVADNTIFVFTTDHGIDFPGAKGTFHDDGIGVFLFMRYPDGNWGKNTVHKQMISNIDILPTLLDACNIPEPPGIEGRNFLPLLGGDSEYQQRQEVFAEKTFHDTYSPTRCIRTGKYKYIRHFEVDIFHDLRLATETRRHYFSRDWRRKSVEELYNLDEDPQELNNIADNQENVELLYNLRSRLLQWMRDTNDPLLNGPVASPYYQRKLQDFINSGKELINRPLQKSRSHT